MEEGGGRVCVQVRRESEEQGKVRREEGGVGESKV